jgi:hypothetical protein
MNGIPIDVLLCMPNGTKCILLVSVTHVSGPASTKKVFGRGLWYGQPAAACMRGEELCSLKRVPRGSAARSTEASALPRAASVLLSLEKTKKMKTRGKEPGQVEACFLEKSKQPVHPSHSSSLERPFAATQTHTHTSAVEERKHRQHAAGDASQGGSCRSS